MKGFTLIELLVSVTIMSLMVGGGVAAYNRFNERQHVSQGAKELVSILRLVQKRVDSGEKPSSGCTTLDGYRVVGAVMQPTLLVYAWCDQASSPNQVLMVEEKIKTKAVLLDDVDLIFLSVSQGIQNPADVRVGLDDESIFETVRTTTAGSIGIIEEEQ